MDLINDDCLNAMAKLPDKSINFILTDVPYGTTQCKWDSVIPFEPMWIELKRVIKNNGCIALFGSEPFSSHLRLSNLNWFKYDLIWDKKLSTGFLNANKMPLRKHENINIFYKKQCIYNPQMREGKERTKGGKKYLNNGVYGDYKEMPKKTYNMYHPTSIKTFSNANQKTKLHPTQKPVALLEYLIKTYTNANDKVLDFTMGSGSTGVACKNTNRNFIGIELDKEYFAIAKQRIESILI